MDWPRSLKTSASVGHAQSDQSATSTTHINRIPCRYNFIGELCFQLISEWWRDVAKLRQFTVVCANHNVPNVASTDILNFPQVSSVQYIVSSYLAHMIPLVLQT